MSSWRAGLRAGPPGGRVVCMWIARPLRDDLIAYARLACPRECCGILAGTGDRVTCVYPGRNIADRSGQYWMHPDDHRAALMDMATRGLEFLGTYHSHPCTEAVPSAEDRRWAEYPDTVTVIVSLLDPAAPDVRGYRVRHDGWDAVEMTVSDGAVLPT